MPLNPYDPNNPADPAVFAGRREFKEDVGEQIERVRRGVHSGILIYGHRGMGKTSAVKVLASKVQDSMPLVRVTLTEETSKAALVERLIPEIKEAVASWSRRHKLKQALRSILERLSSAEFSGLRLQFERGQSNPNLAFKKAIQAASSIERLCITIDDVDLMEKDAFSLIKSCTEEVERPTLLIAISGGPDTINYRLVPKFSPVVRFFSGHEHYLGNFTPEEAGEALRLPLMVNKIEATWSDGAVSEIHGLTLGNPFLIQCFGRAAFHEGTITADDVKKNINKALKTASSWLARDLELQRASDTDIMTFVKICSLNLLQFNHTDARKSGVNPMYLKRLEALGVISKRSRGIYMVEKPPALAIYLARSRGLPL